MLQDQTVFRTMHCYRCTRLRCAQLEVEHAAYQSTNLPRPNWQPAAGPGAGLGSHAVKREFRRLLEAVQAHMEPINAIHAFFNDVVKPTFGA